LEHQLSESGRLHRATVMMPETMSTVQQTGTPAPVIQQQTQAIGEPVATPRVNWSFVGFFVSTCFLGLLSVLVFLFHAL
jgi:hypothetical protein